MSPVTSALVEDILAWAKPQFTDEEIAAGIREIRTTGGLQLSDFIHSLEQAANQEFTSAR